MLVPIITNIINGFCSVFAFILIVFLQVGECSAEVAVPNNVNNAELHSGRIPSTNAAFPEISLDLSLGIGLGNNRAEPEPSIENQDSSSEADDGSGGFGPLF